MMEIKRNSTETLSLKLTLDFDLGTLMEELWNDAVSDDWGKEYKGFKLVWIGKSVEDGTLLLDFKRNL